MATGQGAPRCNITLARTVADLVQTVSHRRAILWEHVFGHTGDPGASGHQQTWTRRRLTRTNWGPRAPVHNTAAAPADPPCPLPWDRFGSLLRDAAVEVFGTAKQNNQPSFYSPSDLDHIMFLMEQRQQCWARVHQARGTADEPALRASLQEAKKNVRTFKQECRNRWVSLIILQDLDDAFKNP